MTGRLDMDCAEDDRMVPANGPTAKRFAPIRLAIIHCLVAMVAIQVAAIPHVSMAQDAAGQTAGALTTPNANGRKFFTNPYSASMTDEDIAKSAATPPAISDGQWEHEACVTAYDWQVADTEFLEQLQAARKKAEDGIKANLGRGTINAAQAKQNFAAVEEAAAKQLESWREKSGRYLKNVAKCQGTFFRPAAIETCALRDSKRVALNPFCQAALGGALAGVAFTDDKLAMGHSVAWNALGINVEDPHGFLETDWFVTDKKEYKEQPFEQVQMQLQLLDEKFEAAYETATRSKQDAIQNVLESEFRSVMRGATYRKISGEQTGVYMGAWHIGLEMIRVKKSELTPDMLDQIRSASTASGIPWDLGDFAQYPRLHFQANIPDVLIQSEVARFTVVSVDGSRTLEAPAPFESLADGAPAMKTSYRSKRVHASSIPTPADWQALRDPDAKLLVATTLMTIEDGSIDQVEIPVSWDGFRDALQDLIRAQQTVSARALEVTAKWDARLAGTLAMAEGYRVWLKKTDSDARALVASRKPLNFNCGSYPSATGDAARNNRLAAEYERCEERWLADTARPHLRQLREYRATLVRSGDDATVALLDIELNRWRNAMENNRIARENYNFAVEQRNRAIREAPPRQAQRSTATSTPRANYSQAWQRGQARNTNRDPKRNYAKEFFESQRNPPPLTRYPPVPVRRPPSYFYSGYN